MHGTFEDLLLCGRASLLQLASVAGVNVSFTVQIQVSTFVFGLIMAGNICTFMLWIALCIPRNVFATIRCVRLI